MNRQEWQQRILNNTTEQRMLRRAVSRNWYVPHPDLPNEVTAVVVIEVKEDDFGDWKVQLRMGRRLNRSLGLEESDPIERMLPEDLELYAKIRRELTRWNSGERDEFLEAQEFGLLDCFPKPMKAETVADICDEDAKQQLDQLMVETKRIGSETLEETFKRAGLDGVDQPLAMALNWALFERLEKGEVELVAKAIRNFLYRRLSELDLDISADFGIGYSEGRLTVTIDLERSPAQRGHSILSCTLEELAPIAHARPFNQLLDQYLQQALRDATSVKVIEP